MSNSSGEAKKWNGRQRRLDGDAAAPAAAVAAPAEAASRPPEALPRPRRFDSEPRQKARPKRWSSCSTISQSIFAIAPANG